MKNKFQKGSADYVVDLRTPPSVGSEPTPWVQATNLIRQAEILRRRSKAARAENMLTPFVDTLRREVQIRLVLK